MTGVQTCALPILEKGNRVFDYACMLQNDSGGWYGSYSVSWIDGFKRGRQKAYYFPDEEISWANKYFLDALAYKEKLEFEIQADIFLDQIENDDGRYQLIRDRLQKQMHYHDERGLMVCDLGCGKGRYVLNLLSEFPDNRYCVCDLSWNVMRNLDNTIEKRQGRLTCIPYEDDAFDYVYICEALEHAIHIEGALKEAYRIAKPEGVIVVIDKPIEQLGKLEIDPWEQWIDDTQVKTVVESLGGRLEIIPSIAYENKDDGLFRAWIITKSTRR